MKKQVVLTAVSCKVPIDVRAVCRQSAHCAVRCHALREETRNPSLGWTYLSQRRKSHVAVFV